MSPSVRSNRRLSVILESRKRLVILSMARLSSFKRRTSDEIQDGGIHFAFRIVAYGDSITYGWTPNPNPPSTRFGPDDRWPGALQKELGNDFQVIEEGLDGRTTDAADPGSPTTSSTL
jgi:lysophospholipase L1-like esterase